MSMPIRRLMYVSISAEHTSSSTARSWGERRNGGGAVKSEKHTPTGRLLAVGCSDLLAFFIGERFWVDEEFIAEIIEIDGERVRLRSSQFNGWALKSDLKAVPA